MKKTFIMLMALFTLTFGIANITHAQIGMGMMGNGWGMMSSIGQYIDGRAGSQLTELLGESLQSIYKGQSVESQAAVDCSQVSDDQFEKLGDAYMGVMLPNTKQHEAMDEMMGGEGSASLRQAHINMGRSYLGCWSNYNSGPIAMPMMGYGGGHGMMGGSGMMGDDGYQTDITRNNYHNDMMDYGFNGFGGMGWFGGGLVMGLFWLLVIAGIVALVRMAMHRGEPHHTATKSALDILKERYAMGEIDKEEFESKKKDI